MTTFDPTKPVQTRDGRKARIVATDAAGPKPIVALVQSDIDSDHEFSAMHRSDGTFIGVRGYGGDLINVPEVTKRYFAIYPDEKGGRGADATEVDAASIPTLLINRDRPLLKVTFENGEYKATEVLA